MCERLKLADDFDELSKVKAQNGQLEFKYACAVKECERLKAENDSLRNALAERNAKYWTLCEAVERLFKTIEGERVLENKIAAPSESA